MSDHNLIHTEDGPVAISPVPVPLTVQYASRSVTMHAVTGTELDTVASLSNSVHLTLFGLCAGGSIAIAIVLTTVNVADPSTHAAYVGALIVSVVMSLYFGIRGGIDHRAAKKKLKELKSGK